MKGEEIPREWWQTSVQSLPQFQDVAHDAAESPYMI